MSGGHAVRRADKQGSCAGLARTPTGTLLSHAEALAGVLLRVRTPRPGPCDSMPAERTGPGGVSERPAHAHHCAAVCAAAAQEPQNDTTPAAHRHPRTVQRRTRMHGTALCVVLLFSAAVSTHMSPDGEPDVDRTGSSHGRRVNAPGTRAATGAILRYARIDGSQSRPAGGADNTQNAGRFTLHASGCPHSSACGTRSAGSEAPPPEDASMEGVVGLSAEAPHGQGVAGPIAGWPIAQAGGPRNRHTQGNQPQVALLDMFGGKQTKFCTGYGGCKDVIFPVTAAISNNPGCSKLHGTTIVQTVNGVATFTDLMIENPESIYRLRFTTGLRLSPIAVTSAPFKVMKGQIYIPDDPLWNYIATASKKCQCGAVTLPFLPQLNIRAGEVVRSSPGGTWPDASLQPCTGYEFPTVWVRKFNMRDPRAGSECDGWEDVINWDFDIRVAIQEFQGCIFIDSQVEEPVCRTGMHGVLTFRSSCLLSLQRESAMPILMRINLVMYCLPASAQD